MCNASPVRQISSGKASFKNWSHRSSVHYTYPETIFQEVSSILSNCMLGTYREDIVLAIKSVFCFYYFWCRIFRCRCQRYRHDVRRFEICKTFYHRVLLFSFFSLSPSPLPPSLLYRTVRHR